MGVTPDPNFSPQTFLLTPLCYFIKMKWYNYNVVCCYFCACFVFQFIDLCILMGCDYCPSIKGIGMKKSIELIKKYKNIETILQHIDKGVRLNSEGVEAWKFTGMARMGKVGLYRVSQKHVWCSRLSIF